MHEYIISKMEDQRDFALTTLSKIFPNYTTEMSLVLARGFFDELEPAINIASQLDLGTLDFCAIIGDEKSYKEEFIRELDEKRQEECYERSLRYA